MSQCPVERASFRPPTQGSWPSLRWLLLFIPPVSLDSPAEDELTLSSTSVSFFIVALLGEEAPSLESLALSVLPRVSWGHDWTSAGILELSKTNLPHVPSSRSCLTLYQICWWLGWGLQVILPCFSLLWVHRQCLVKDWVVQHYPFHPLILGKWWYGLEQLQKAGP